ncbi:MAG: hypothetical protein E7140_00935 [Rikenellaceae bacterium]|nr:hypothetical protein [Rikenellaceae bacterium]
MKRLLLILASAVLAVNGVFAQANPNIPTKLFSGPWKAGHVQGVAVDTKQEYIYLSFTTMLVKMDMKGNVVGTVTGLLGHLGCLEFNDADGRLYGSLEYKNDSIGRSILNREGVSGTLQTGFYVAIFDVNKINREGMSAERDGVMTSVLLKTVVEDYSATVKDANGNELKHRHGCSGFDGISFGPAFDGSGKTMLTIAYGIYRGKNRSDNDYQVLLQYDTTDWKQYEQPLSQNNMHNQGPEKPYGKYFVRTGNTSWGVQNMEYDKASNLWFLACYPGKKDTFANYTLFAIDGAKLPVKKKLVGVKYVKKANVLTLAKVGSQDDQNSDIYGWYNKLGVYGIHSFGGGDFYLVSAGKTEEGRTAKLHRARYVGTETKAFELE